MTRFWRCLEEFLGPAGVASLWQRRVGDEFATAKAAFLQARPKPAVSLPCPHECGCAHAVVRHDDGRIVAVCRCEPWNCDDIPLIEADLVVYELSWPKLGRAIARAFGCEPKADGMGLPGTRQVAAFGGIALPVFLSIQTAPADFRSVVGQLAARQRGGFILLAPTNRFLDATARELLGNAKAGFFDLESNLTLLPTGALRARKAGGELFAPYLPEKADEIRPTEAQRVFAILMRLKSKRAGMKAPLHDVFVWVVLKNLSQKQAALECECSRGLMSARVGELEKEFGRSVEELKALATPILEMQRAVKGDRMQKKKSGAQHCGPGGEEGADGGEDGAPKEEYRYDPDEGDG